MKISKKLLLTFLSLVIILSGASLFNVAAQSNIKDQQIDRILSSCVTARNTLSQLHASDALLRVNRGQIYESMSTKLMSGFNGRVSNNDFDNSNLASILSSYDLALDTFRLDYKSYEEHLSAAIGINCSKQPTSFYDAVAVARSKRKQVHDDILKLNQYVDQYGAAIDKFEQDYLGKVYGAGY